MKVVVIDLLANDRHPSRLKLAAHPPARLAAAGQPDAGTHPVSRNRGAMRLEMFPRQICCCGPAVMPRMQAHQARYVPTAARAVA